MIPTPDPTEVNRLATDAIERREKEDMTWRHAIETVCGESRVPKTDTPLTMGDLRSYIHRLETAVAKELHQRTNQSYQSLLS